MPSELLARVNRETIFDELRRLEGEAVEAEQKLAEQEALLIRLKREHQDVSRIAGDETVVIGPEECASKFLADFRTAAPGSKLTVGDITVAPVAAYNIDKQFHPRDKGWVGYLLEIGGKLIYHAGDTDFTPEMKELKNAGVDVALLPVGLTSRASVTHRE